MPKAKCSEREFVALFESRGAQETARQLGLAVRNVYERRAAIEARQDKPLVSPDMRSTRLSSEYPNRMRAKITDGVVLIGSDAHLWPGDRTCAWRALEKFAIELKPALIDLNGDVHDGARISRHPPRGWSHLPSVSEELAYDEKMLDSLRGKAGKAQLFWTLGNHDFRFESKLAQQSPEHKGVQGFSLKDHFPHWQLGMSLWINDDVVVKHRFKGGIHATHNNTLWSGKNMVTGHLHSLKVMPFTDYNGERYGVDSGSLMEILPGQELPEQCDYNEDNPANHRSGLVVLTFWRGRLLPPELVHVLDAKRVVFRGQIITV